MFDAPPETAFIPRQRHPASASPRVLGSFQNARHRIAHEWRSCFDEWGYTLECVRAVSCCGFRERTLLAGVGSFLLMDGAFSRKSTICSIDLGFCSDPA